VCKVQVLLITIQPYYLFDMSVNCKHAGDDVLSVTKHTIHQKVKQQKDVALYVLYNSQFVSVLCGHVKVLDTANFSGKCTHNVLEMRNITSQKCEFLVLSK
jgi:hypothetical protein